MTTSHPQSFDWRTVLPFLSLIGRMIWRSPTFQALVCDNLFPDNSANTNF